MSYATTLRTQRFVFADLREVFAKANEEKSGDHLAGIAATSERERVAAKFVLADVRLSEIVAQPLIDPDSDEVSRLILDTQDQAAFRALASLTVGEFREYLLDDSVGEEDLRRLHWAITPEMAAAVAKLMSNLVLVASKIRSYPLPQHHGSKRGARHPAAAEPPKR
jgi:ethanolamine ammonia-lyase large subunit